MQMDLLFERGNKLSETLIDNYNESFGYKAHLYVVTQKQENRSNDLATVFGETASQFRVSEFTEKKDVSLLLGQNDFIALDNRSDISINVISTFPIRKGMKIEIRIHSHDVVYWVIDEPTIGPHNLYRCTISPFLSSEKEGSVV